MNRRDALRSLFNGVLQAAGTVLLAQSALGEPAGVPAAAPAGGLKERADRLASEAEAPAGGEELCSFLNFRNGGFHNGGFHNGFRNGGFYNGGFHNGGFYNGGFRNGGWRNY